jgi:hypothetical protein
MHTTASTIEVSCLQCTRLRSWSVCFRTILPSSSCTPNTIILSYQLCFSVRKHNMHVYRRILWIRPPPPPFCMLALGKTGRRLIREIMIFPCDDHYQLTSINMRDKTSYLHCHVWAKSAGGICVCVGGGGGVIAGFYDTIIILWYSIVHCGFAIWPNLTRM